MKTSIYFDDITSIIANVEDWSTEGLKELQEAVDSLVRTIEEDSNR